MAEVISVQVSSEEAEAAATAASAPKAPEVAATATTEAATAATTEATTTEQTTTGTNPVTETATASTTTTDQPKPVETPAPTTATAQAELDQAATEIIAAGKLTEATLTALTAKGLTEAQAKVYAAGIKAQAQEATTKLAERVGGKDTLNAIMTWAKQGGLTDAERSAYDSLMTSGNEAQMTLALDGLKARHEAALGSPHARLNAASTATDSAVKPFASTQEVVRAMSSQKYKTDPAYRAQIQDRLAVSDAIQF